MSKKYMGEKLDIMNWHLGKHEIPALKERGLDISKFIPNPKSSRITCNILSAFDHMDLSKIDKSHIPDFNEVPNTYEELSTLDKNRFMSNEIRSPAFEKFLIVKHILATNLYKNRKPKLFKISDSNLNNEIYELEKVCRFVSFLRSLEYVGFVESKFNPDSEFIKESTISFKVEDVYEFLLQTKNDHYIEFGCSGYDNIYNSGAFPAYHKYLKSDSVSEIISTIYSDMKEFIYLTRFEGIDRIEISASLVSQFSVMYA